MKTFAILLVTITITSAAFAQSASQHAPATSIRHTDMKDGVLNKDGKIWYIKQLTGAMSLHNGVEAETTGSVKLANGKTINLNDGDCINFDGVLIGLNQKNTTVDGLVMKRNGTMWVWSILDHPLELKNGTYAMPDGTLKTKEGKYIKIADKEFVDMEGTITMSTK